MPRVSVVIPTHNRVTWLPEAVESVLGQTYRDIELIVVDDASSDDTAELVQSRWPTVRYLRLDERRGPSAARNAGLHAAASEWIAFLDSDDLWLPRKLERQLGALERTGRYRVCYTDEIWVRNGRRVNPKKKHHKHSGWIFAHSLRLCIVSPSSVVMHRSFFEEVGEFDESLPACEDYDLWLRASCRMPFLFVPEKLIVKRGGHEDQLSRQWGLDVYRVRALEKLLEKAPLSARQRRLAASELVRRCRILEQGFRKRGRVGKADYYARLAAHWESEQRREGGLGMA